MAIDAVSKYGFDPNGMNDNTAAAQAMMVDLASQKYMPQVRFVNGRYIFSSCPNLALKNLDLRGEGLVEFVHTGAGNAFTFDGNSKGPGGGGLFNLTVDNIRFRPGVSTYDTLTLNSIHHSDFNIKVLGAPSGHKALAVYWNVCTNFYYTCSGFDDRDPAMADCFGVWLDKVTAPADWQATDCVFYSPIIESVRIGMNYQDAGGIKLIGGTIEGCSDTGVHIETGGQNRAYGTWFEGNKNNDVSFGPGAKDNCFDVDHPSGLKVSGGNFFSNNTVQGIGGLFG